MKKVLALVLAVVLCMGLATVAFAAAGDGTATTDGSKKVILTVKVAKTFDGNDDPDSYFKAEDLKASIKWNDGKEYFDKVELDDAAAADTVEVTVKFKDYYGTDDQDIDFDLSLLKGSSKKKLYTPATDNANCNALVDAGFTDGDTAVNVTWTFGWGTATRTGSDDDDALFTIGGSNAVFKDLDAVTFATFEFADNDAISVAGKMSKQDAINMTLDVAVNDEIKALMKKNEDVDFDVLNFVGKPEFDFTQEVTYVLDDTDKEYFVYEIKNGKATKVNAKLNDDKDALVWKTRVLGAYIVTDAEIKAADAAAEDKTETGDKENPETGASDFVGVAVALGAVSLVAAGAVALKK